ncbi:formate dehydrogenase accessory protein FdhE [Brevibacillus ginsengisoli]|uniref:formate dehydrogenase accessory protein FdhE n=1 Tax=Brevibacillus ginsengisoli TaxID=363854 RepID=UPI003CE7B6D2
MVNGVVSQAYENIQKNICALQQKWRKQVDASALVSKVIDANVPLLAHNVLSIPAQQYQTFMLELTDFLQENKVNAELDFSKIKKLVEIEGGSDTFVANALTVNLSYFHELAQEYGTSEQMVHVIAEHGIRPFLQAFSAHIGDSLTDVAAPHSCKVCGEPFRLAIFNDKKVVTCTRCYSQFQEKRLKCSHCDNDDHTHLRVLKVENDEQHEVLACEKCNGYMKIITTSEKLDELIPDLLDLQTIHLDIIAQDNGFGGNDSSEQ